MNSGYSGTPLEKKLGLKNGFNCLLINAPTTYLTWFNALDMELLRNSEGENTTKDFVHLFCKSKEVLERYYFEAKIALKTNGMLWISWPKKSGSIKASISENEIRSFVLQNGLVDIKIAAIDADWSGLKFVYRLKDRT